jgi:outer membrane lipoprotein-sorting protein
MKHLSLSLGFIILSSFSGVLSAGRAGGFGAITAGFDCSFFHLVTMSAPQASTDPVTLDTVLKKMDTVAANFHTTQANFEWDTYQKVIDEVDDVEKGVVYYRRTGKGVEMMAVVKEAGTSAAALKPEPKYVLFAGEKIRMYQPKLDQVTEFDLGKAHSDWESYVQLGFGGSGQDLKKNFEVSYEASETIDGVNTARLRLVPKSEKVRNTYGKIFLWVDLDRGISVQQKLFTPQDDYKLAKYFNIKINEKIPEDDFKLKTTSKTQTISPRG